MATATGYNDPSGNLANVIDDNATLATATRAAGDYDNSANGYLWGILKLTVQYDGGPPSVGDDIADIWIIPGDAAGTEKFAEGGDAGLGTDDDPQDCFHVGTMRSVNPSLTVNEVLMLPPVRLYPHGNRVVLKNVSGQTFDATWQLDLLPYRLATA